MEMLGSVVRFAHVAFGFVGLAAFWVPVFAKKGAVNHVRFGRIFVVCAYVVLAGAALALLLRMLENASAGIGPGDQPALYAFMVFLAYLTLVTFVIVRHGMGVLRHKRNPAALKTNTNSLLAYLSVGASLFLIGYALVMRPPNAILLYALSPIGFGVGFGNLRYMRSSAPSPREWMYEHLGAMLGAGIAFHTAFAVFGAGQLLELGLSGWLQVIPWVLPAAVGIPATVIWTRHYRRRFGELA